MMMRVRSILLIVVPLLLIAGGVAVWWWSRPGAQPVARLCVVNTLSKDLSVIDPVTQKSLGRIPLQAYGYGVAVSKNGDRAYVTTGPFPRGGKVKEAAASELLEVDLQNSTVIRHVGMPELAPLSRVHLTQSEREACIVTAAMPGKRNLQRGRVIFVDLVRGSVSETVNIGINPLDSLLTPDGKTLFTADWGSNSISVIDVSGRRLADTIPLVDSSPRLLACSADGGKIYAALDSSEEGSLLEIDTRTHTVSALPRTPHMLVTAMTATGDGLLYLAGRDQTRWGRTVAPQQMTRQYIAQTTPHGESDPYGSAGRYAMVAYDPARGKITKRYDTSVYIAALAPRRQDNLLYLVSSADDRQSSIMYNVASNSGDSFRSRPSSTTSAALRTVSIFDPKSGDSLTSIPVGEFPQGCAVNGR